MKKVSLLTIALIITLMASTASANNGYGLLYAGQNLLVGDVTVQNDGSTLSINLWTRPGYNMAISHVHVATALDDVPTNKNGNPKVGHFSEKHTHGAADARNYTFYIAMPTEWPSTDPKVLYIAVHTVIMIGEAEETAWGLCDSPLFGGQFNGNSWATYLIYYPDQPLGWSP